MSKNTRIFTLVLLVLVFSNLGPTTVKAQTSLIPAIEREALVALYNSTDGDNWTDNTNWLVDPDPCNWYGILCLNGHVDTIVLDENNLVGALPPEIGHLSDVLYLNLSKNQLSSIPTEIGNLTKLSELDLRNNQLTTIPSTIGDLSVSFLYLGDNYLTNLPAGIGNLKNVGQLSLRNNHLTEIPPEIGNIPFTYSNEDLLDITNNELSRLPAEIYNLANLEQLYLSGNEIHSLHHNLGKMESLTVLELGSNHLTCLPEEIGDLINLRRLVLSDNDITYLPPEIGNLMNLRFLISENNKLKDLPPDIENLSNLSHLDLSHNQLSTFPTEICALSNLWELDLSHNLLSGRISHDIGSLTQLYFLDLSRNALSEEIPGTITNIIGFFTCPWAGHACQYFSPFADFSFNMLYSSDEIIQDYLDTIDPDWAETQTVYPSQTSVKDVRLNSVELSWVPILYTRDGGYYQIGYATTPGGPYTIHGRTSDKTASGYVLDYLENYTDYNFVVRTFTPAHDDQPNDLLTGYSDEIHQKTLLFSDVAFDHWAEGYIEVIYNAGITTGCSAAPLMYCPEKTTTRAETAVFLEKGIHGPGFFPPDVAPSFGDTAGHWAEDWIEALYSDGITSGCSQDPLLFCPNSSTSRAEMAVFLLKAKHGNAYTPPPASGGAFTDMAGHWAEDWIEQLAAEGITSGYPDGTFKPDQTVTRAEMAVFLVNTFGIPLP